MTRSRSRSATSRTPSGRRPARREKPVLAKAPRYTVVIQWSDEDDCYVVSLPEWGPYCKTHGGTYEEAAKNAREVLELLTETEAPQMTPPPQLFRYPGAAVIDLPDDAVGLRKREPEAGAKRRTA